jgi:hypothetical protein
MNERNSSSLSPSKRLAEIEEMCRAKDEVIRHLQRDLEQQVRPFLYFYRTDGFFI